MKVTQLKLDHLERLLDLEEKMYWQKLKWKELWEKEAKEKFRILIKDYLTSYPQGCFGVADDSEELIGAMFLTKVSKFKPIPYLHKVSDYLEENGEIAYVSFFVVEKGKKELEIAQKIYDHADEVVFLKLKCKKICVVIYSSPIELKALQSHNYERLDGRFEWQIYSEMKVPVSIYYYDLLMKQGT